MSRLTAPAVRSFTRHFAEMCLAMVLGMAVLGMLGGAVLSGFGVGAGELRDDAPAALLVGMALSMTLPMVGWMRYRGHGWPASLDMAAAMFLPTFAAIGLLAAGTVEDVNALLAIQHVAMLPSMLVAMLLRRGEYTGGAAAHAHA